MAGQHAFTPYKGAQRWGVIALFWRIEGHQSGAFRVFAPFLALYSSGKHFFQELARTLLTHILQRGGKRFDNPPAHKINPDFCIKERQNDADLPR